MPRCIAKVSGGKQCSKVAPANEKYCDDHLTERQSISKNKSVTPSENHAHTRKVKKIRCCGRKIKSKFQRCQIDKKIRWLWPFCRYHTWQPVTLGFLVLGIVADLGGAIDFLFPNKNLVKELLIEVLDTNGEAVPNIAFRIKGKDLTSYPTNSHGNTSIEFQKGILPGSWLSLELIDSSILDEWVFISPWNKRIPIPLSGNRLDNSIEIIIGKRGDRALLENATAVFSITSKLNSEILRPTESRDDLLASIASEYDLVPQDIDSAIRKWKELTKNPTWRGLAALYEGNYIEALNEFELALDSLDKNKEERIAEYVNNTKFLARTFWYMGEPLKAEAALKRALEYDGHNGTLFNDLGASLQLRGKFHEAEAFLQLAIQYNIEEFGVESPIIAVNIANLASVKHDLKKYAQAETLYKQVLEFDKAHYGPGHPEVAHDMNNIATLYQDAGYPDKAMELFISSFNIELIALYDLPRVHNILGDAPTSNLSKIRKLQKRLDDVIQVDQTGSPLRLYAITANLVSAFTNQERYREARPYCELLLAFAEIYTPGQVEHSNALWSLALSSLSMGNVEEAIIKMKQSINYREMNIGKSEKLANDIHYLATVLSANQQFSVAEQEFRRALKLYDELLLPSSESNRIGVRYNVGKSLFDQGKYAKAEKYLRESMELFEASYKEPNKNLIMTKGILSESLFEQGKIQEASLLCSEALRLARALLGLKDNTTITLQVLHEKIRAKAESFN